MNEVQEYEKERAIENDEKLKRKSNISLSSRVGDGGVSRSNSKFKSLANRVSQTIAGANAFESTGVVPMKDQIIIIIK